MPHSTIPVITIDGPTASGKGTVAHRVADHLGFHLLDSGALYRLTALSAMRRGTDFQDEHAVSKVAEHLPARFNGGHIFLGTEDVSHAIRAEEVGNLASKIAALPRVREALYGLQLGFRQTPGLVADGRDMGSVVFPDAELKVYLTADPEVRAQRRHKEVSDLRYEEVAASIAERDARDEGRAHGPLVESEDAVTLDTTGRTVDDVVAEIVEMLA